MYYEIMRLSDIDSSILTKRLNLVSQSLLRNIEFLSRILVQSDEILKSSYKKLPRRQNQLAE